MIHPNYNLRMQETLRAKAKRKSNGKQKEKYEKNKITIIIIVHVISPTKRDFDSETWKTRGLTLSFLHTYILIHIPRI